MSFIENFIRARTQALDEKQRLRDAIEGFNQIKKENAPMPPRRNLVPLDDAKSPVDRREEIAGSAGGPMRQDDPRHGIMARMIAGAQQAFAGGKSYKDVRPFFVATFGPIEGYPNKWFLQHGRNPHLAASASLPPVAKVKAGDLFKGRGLDSLGSGSARGHALTEFGPPATEGGADHQPDLRTFDHFMEDMERNYYAPPTEKYGQGPVKTGGRRAKKIKVTTPRIAGPR